MLVKAKRLGYYDHKRRKEGDVFSLDSKDDFSEKWMEPADADEIQEEEKPVEVKVKRGKAAAKPVIEA